MRLYNEVLLFPNIRWPAVETDYVVDQAISRLNPSISYSEAVNDSSITTLSARNSPASGTIKGLLYVPDLPEDDPCNSISTEYVPANVTRQANLPATDFTLIALAPWINVECTKAYLTAARQDPVRAFIFYWPEINSTAHSPVVSPQRRIDYDGKWKFDNTYPVFAVSTIIGTRMMQELSMYSGNLTDVPFGHQLAATAGVDPRDYVRIFSRIHTSSSSNVPSVWIFLLVIFGILVFMLAMTSAVMHLLQIHRRNALRRRIENGEVNLESMGIKRLTVPSAIVNQMSCFTYNHGTQNLKKLPVDNEKPRSVIQSLEAGQTPRNDERTSEVDVAVLSIDVEKACSATIPQELRSYAQTECPICLDNFEVGVTPVRQLPCGHIFHPECIDYFLGHHSSLCPMCKKSVLPLGYCPTDITNNMVRRERNMRRLRSRVTVHSSTDNETAHRMKRFQDWSIGVGKQIFQSTFSVANYRPRSPASLHAREVQSHTPPQVTLSSTEIPMPLTPGLSRQEIAQRRGRALIARSVSLEDVDTARNQRRPKWRRRLARAFPGFS